MKTTESRIAALEQSAKLSAAQNKPTIVLNFAELRAKIQEVLSREQPVLTQAEQIQKFKDTLKQMDRDWELRHGHGQS